MATTNRIRRPARGGVVVEFLVGLFGGILASLMISSLVDFSTPSIPVMVVDKQNKLTTTTPILRYGEWRAKERLPGYKDPKILCVVTQNLDSDLVPAVVNVTWGSRCDRLVFTWPRLGMDPTANISFEIVQVEKMGAKDTEWRTYRSLLMKLEIEDADYIFFVDDMTYAIPDNVRYEFRGLNPGEGHLFWGRKFGEKISSCSLKAFILSRTTAQALKAKLNEVGDTICGPNSVSAAAVGLSHCLESINVQCKEAIDFQGKLQIMDDPIRLLSSSEIPAHLRKDPQCCSVLPLAFVDVGRMIRVRTGSFSYLYFYDYFIRDTAVFGREYLRPLNGIDAGVGKPQIGF